MATLVDTNVLVYRFDPRDARKQAIATERLRTGVEDGSLRLAHQTIVEFIAAVIRPIGGAPLLEPAEAALEADLLMTQFEVLHPDAALLRLALRGWVTYQLAWFDAHMWAYAEHYGLDTLLSEDFQHARQYGTVRVVDPFRQSS